MNSIPLASLFAFGNSGPDLRRRGAGPFELLRRVLQPWLLVLAFLPPIALDAQSAARSVVTYQGYLATLGTPAAGVFDMTFTLKDAAVSGTTVGTTQNVPGVVVSNGLFTANLDLLSEWFDGNPRWLEIAVKGTRPGSAFVVLAPRQRVGSAPYALTAANALSVDTGVISNPTFVGTTTETPFDLWVAGERAFRLFPCLFSPTIVAGHFANDAHGTCGSVIAGGGALNAANEIGLTSHFSVVGGGRANTIGDASACSIVAGGESNRISFTTQGSTISGGHRNGILSSSDFSTIAGGRGNLIQADGTARVIGGGWGNQILPSSAYAVIDGGRSNVIGAFANYSSIGGGTDNQIGNNVTLATIGGGSGNINMSPSATVAGGSRNSIGERSDGSSIGGGANNAVGGFAKHATIPGGLDNGVGDTASFSLAAGRRAQANHQGTFVWGDATDADVTSSTSNSVTMRASGGIRFFSTTDTVAPAPGVSLAAGGSAWSTISDRNAKKDFAPVDGAEILEKLARMPVQQWHYRHEGESTTPHIGPMAQDFKAAFYPGRDDRTITTLEFDGVALAAIQGLNHKVESERRRLEHLEAENASLRQSLEKLQGLVESLRQRVPAL